jgi:DNA-binding response OmpR family regulator
MTSVVELAEHLARPVKVLVLSGAEAGGALIDALSAYDCDLIVVSSIEEAVKEFSARHFDIVFISLKPDIVDIVRELKHFSPKTAIVLVSENNDAGNVLDRVLTLGMVGLLRKPTPTAINQVRETLDLFKLRVRHKKAVSVVA